MSSNTSEAATTAIDQEAQDNQTTTADQEARDSSTATTSQDSQISAPSNQGQETQQQTATTRQESDNDATALTGQPAQGGQPPSQPASQSTATEQQGQSSQTPRSEPGAQDRAATGGGADPHADDTAKMASQPKPDVSDQDYQELLPKLLNHFHNNREELARALGLHRSTVDRWLNGKSRPNNSTVLRMRRLAQERRIE